MKTAKLLFVALGVSVFATTALAQEQRPYRDGPVTEMSYIKVKAGKFDEYMRYLAGPYRKLQDENKKAGLITGWSVHGIRARTPSDPDVVLVTVYPNMAALDRSEEGDVVSSRVMGSFSTMDKAFADRGSMREVLGSQVMRELVLR